MLQLNYWKRKETKLIREDQGRFFKEAWDTHFNKNEFLFFSSQVIEKKKININLKLKVEFLYLQNVNVKQNK